MGNHIHLQIKPGPHESLSAIMRWLLGNFAKAYNKQRGSSGHFWGDRFHSRVLNGLRQLTLAFGYIDENPVRAGLTERACEWPQGAAWHRLRGDGSLLADGLPWLSLLESFRLLPLALPSGGR